MVWWSILEKYLLLCKETKEIDNKVFRLMERFCSFFSFFIALKIKFISMILPFFNYFRLYFFTFIDFITVDI